ncbi:hypothetical protein [Adhaeribacter aquaticus]|uniref:hypothetical protein n=1 Tax=Adhaeribacter aquaticus TaxID=299567 RepID=UPI00041E38E2|nr:hypothetical protein [Adhaeribacter aquaticus]
MPEGPEMVFLKEQAAQFIGCSIISATGQAPHLPFQELPEQTLNNIRTFGKEIFFCFSDLTIRIHLMLFGKYSINGELNRELRLGLEFETGTINFYACDCRIISQPLNDVYDWSSDVMQKSFNPEKALEKLYKEPKKLICEALLDQAILAGVGNGIKNEVLYQRQIHPESQVGEIPPEEVRKLINACVTFSAQYLRWLQEGNRNEHWQVYRQKVCPRDQIPLRKEKIGKGGRSCYFCDKCQQLYHINTL